MTRKLLFFGLFSFILTSAFADMVYLKNKNNIEGIIEKEDENRIILNIGYGEITIERKDIDNIYRSTEQEQRALRKTWSSKYFTRPEFIPESLRAMAKDFNELEDIRAKAIENKRTKDKSKDKISKLENELEKLGAELAKVSAKITQFKPEDNLGEYNSLVEESNSLLAQIRLNEYNKDIFQKQIVVLDKEVSGYFNDLSLFKKKFKQAYADLSKDTSNKDGSYFFEGVKKKLEEMDKDFTGHKIDYSRLGPHIIVNALLNNLVKAELIVDTGASLVVISQQIADKLGLELKDKEKERILLVTLADGTKVEAKAVLLKSIKVGEVEVENVPTAVLNREVTSEDGLLGMSFLEKFLVSIDPKENRLILEEFNP